MRSSPLMKSITSQAYGAICYPTVHRRTTTVQPMAPASTTASYSTRKTPATAGSGCAPLITAVVTRLLGDAKLAIPSTVPTSEWRSGRARVVYHAGPAAPRARRVHEGGRPLSSGRPNRSCSDRLAAFWEVSPSAGKSIIQVCTSTVHRRVGLPPEREAAGRKTSSSNTEPVLETNTAKLTRLVKAFNEPSRAWREVLDKEGDAREAVGMLCQSDLRLRLYERAPPRQARREYRVSAPPGDLGRDGSGKGIALAMVSADGEDTRTYT